MGFTRRLYDWLGNRLDGDGETVSAIVAESNRLAMTDVALRTCASYVSAAIAKADVVAYRRGERDETSWDAYAWGVSPNRNQTRAEFVDELVWKLYSQPRAIVVPDGGSLYVADGCPTPEKNPPFGEFEYANLSVNGASVPGRYKASQVFAFSLGNPDVQKLVNGMGESYGVMLGAAERMFRERAAKKFKLKVTAMKGSRAGEEDPYKKYVENDLKKFMESDSAVIPEYNGYQLEPFYSSQALVGMSTDFTTLRKDCFEAVATAMRMPISLLYGNVNNFSEVFRSFVTFTVQPVASMLETEISRKLYGLQGWRYGDRLRIDLSRLKYTDIFDAAADADKLVASSLLSPNDTLRFLGLDGIDDAWADDHYITKNDSPVGDRTAGGGEENG